MSDKPISDLVGYTIVGSIFLFGFMCAAIPLTVALKVKPEIVRQCEKSLPRDQHCKLMAVIDEGEK